MHDYKADCQCYKCKGIRGSKSKPVKRIARKQREKVADRETQNARYIDCGYNNWDDRD